MGNIETQKKEIKRHLLKEEQVKYKSFWLSAFIREQEQLSYEYKHFKDDIKIRGHYLFSDEKHTVKVYTPELAIILSSNKLISINPDTKEETTINPSDFFKIYIHSYCQGEQYFENKIKVSPNNLYGANAEQYVKDIHSNYFHIQHVSNGGSGWGYVKHYSPLMVTHKAIKELGYYSGIVSKVEEQINKHSEIFRAFYKNVHNNSSQKENNFEIT